MNKMLRLFSVLSFFLAINSCVAIKNNLNSSHASGTLVINNRLGEGREVSLEEMIGEIAILQNKTADEVRTFYVNKEIEAILSTTGIALTHDNSALLESLAMDNLVALSYYTDAYPLGTIAGKNGWSHMQEYNAFATLYYSYVGSTSMRHIQSVLYVGIIGLDNHDLYKSYAGDFFINVEAEGKIHYIVNGSYFNTGMSSTGLSIYVPVGSAVTVSISASNTTNLFAGIYVTGDRYSLPR